jgi:hypothetical protein
MRFRYTAWLVVKLLAAVLITAAIYEAAQVKTVQDTFDGILIGFWMLPMLFVGMVFLAVLDQRFRCRACGRRRRMPVAEGNYGGMLLDHPGTEYVCPYGHGKLRVEVWISAGEPPEWTQYGDMWEELFTPRAAGPTRSAPPE